MYGRTSIRQKSGSEDSSVWLYWSLCKKSHSNNLKNTSCAALAPQQMDRCVPVWLETGCLQKAPNAVGAELQLLRGWRGCLSVHNPSSLPDLLCLCSPFAVYTCLVQTCPQTTLDSVPQRKERRRWRRLQGQEALGPEVRRHLLFSLKGDLKGSDSPRFTPKTCNLHTAWPITFSAIVSMEQMLEKLLGRKNPGIFSLPLAGVEMEAGSLFFCSWALKTLSRAVMSRWVLVHRFKRSLPAQKNRNCLLLVTVQGFWAVEQQFCFLKRGKAVMSV